MQSSFFLGIDGGGSKTRAVVINEEGIIIGAGISNSSNYHDVGLKLAQTHIREAISNAYPEIFLNKKMLRRIFLGLAGILSSEDKTAVYSIMEGLSLTSPANIEVDHDIRIALAGGTFCEQGIALIAGTGSSCYGRNSKGQTWRTSGWGHILDDKGSGYYLGLEAIKAAARMQDGRGESTILLPLVLDFFKLKTLEDVQREMSHGKLDRAKIATLSTEVLKLENVDVLATRIIEKGSLKLAEMVLTVAKKLHFTDTPFKVILVGGVITNSASYQNRVRQEINDVLPCASVELPLFPPVVGAALLAMQHTKSETSSEEIKQNIQKSLIHYSNL